MENYRDPRWGQLEQRLAPNLAGFLGNIRMNGERSNNSQVSEIGARSVYQISPDTRARIIKTQGFDPWSSPENAVRGAAVVASDAMRWAKGDPTAAAGYYHAGGNTNNWGPRTAAYVGRTNPSMNKSTQNMFAEFAPQARPKVAPGNMFAEFAGSTGQAKAPPKRKPTVVDKTVPTADDVTGGTIEGLLAGIGHGMTLPYYGARQLLGLDSQQEVDNRKRLDKPLLSTTRGAVGNVIGNMAITLPAAAIPGANTMTGAMLIGAAQGGLEPVGTGESRSSNMVGGGVGGAVGLGAGKLVGRIAKPVRSTLGQEQARLAAEAQRMGIQLTPAQLTGSKPLQVVDSVLANLPFSAGRIQALKQAQQAAVNRQVGSSFGKPVDELSPEIIDSALGRLKGEFNRLSANNKVKLDGTFFSSIDDVARSHSQLTPHMQNSNVLGLADDFRSLAAAGEIDGKAYQVMRSKLSKDANGAYQAGNSYLGDALKGFRNALDDAAARSISDADKAAWNTARRQYANLKTVTSKGQVIDEAGNVKLGVLAAAVRNKDKTGYARGKAGDLDAISRVAKALVRDPIPDSGTAQRMFWQGLLTGGTGIAGLTGALSPYQLAMLPMPWALSRAIHSNAGRKYLTQGLIRNGSMLTKPAVQGALLRGASAAATPAFGLLSVDSSE